MKRSATILLTLALLAAPAPGQDADAPGPERTLREVVAAAADDAARADALGKLAEFFEEGRRFDEAASTWRQALRAREDETALRGHARALKGFAEQVLFSGAPGAEIKAAFTDAQIALGRVRDSGVSDVQVGLDLARCADALGETDRQLAGLTALEKAHPEDVRPKRALAFALLVAGRNEDALGRFEELSAEDPKDAQLARGLAHVAAAVGKEDLAAAAAKRAVRAAPEWNEAWQSLWRLYAPERRFGELSNATLELAAEAEVSAPGAHYAGFALSYAARFDEALVWLAKAWELDPGNDNARLEAARILREEKRDRDAAVALYDAILERRPGQSQAVEGLFFIARRVSETDGHRAAEPFFRRVAAAQPENGLAWADLALARRWTGRYDEAKTTYLKAIEIEPDDAQIRNDFGLLLIVMRLDGEARATFRAGIEVDELHNDCMENLGFMARADGNPAEALAWFLQAWRAAIRRGEDGARHRRNTDDIRWPLPPL